MDIEVSYKFKNSNNQLEEIKLSFYKEENYYNVINLTEPLADGIEFTSLEDFKEKLIEYINNNYGLYNNDGDPLEENYYSDRKRIKYYIFLVKNFLNENII